MNITDVYLEICEKALDSFAMRCNVEKTEINLQTSTQTITKGNIALFGHILLDLHEQYETPITYKEFTQYQEFPTIEKVVTHFYESQV